MLVLFNYSGSRLFLEGKNIRLEIQAARNARGALHGIACNERSRLGGISGSGWVIGFLVLPHAASVPQAALVSLLRLLLPFRVVSFESEFKMATLRAGRTHSRERERERRHWRSQ
jgi:hypothetical protein